MTHDDFEIGDVVRLNTALTRMTVDKIDPENLEGAVSCIWFGPDGELKRADFHPPQLIKERASA